MGQELKRGKEKSEGINLVYKAYVLCEGALFVTIDVVLTILNRQLKRRLNCTVASNNC